MTTFNLTSACRYCRYYQPEGRRGGICQQLGVPVKACWKSCAMAIPPFTSWESVRDFVFLEKSFSLSIEGNNEPTITPIKQAATVEI